MKHSPTPWKWEDRYFIYGADGELVTTDAAGVFSDENAAFIVEACNNYEALQERVKELEEALNKCVDGLSGNVSKVMCNSYFKQYEQLLNKAIL